MKIRSIELWPVAVKRRTGFLSRHVIVEIKTDEGVTGWGEMSDFGHIPVYVPDLADLERTLNRLLAGQDPRHITDLTSRLLEVFPEEMFMYDMSAVIRCGIDVALHDLTAKSLDVSVSAYLGGRMRDRLRVCYPIFRHRTTAEVATNLERVDEYLKEGFDLIRLYAGQNVLADELFLRTLRERFGHRVAVKSLDFSNLVPWRTAVEATKRLAPYGFELIESPCPRDDLDGLLEVRRRVDHPISEHVCSTFQAKLFLQRGGLDIFNICTTFIGGITPARKLFALAESAGVACLIGTTQELSLGTAAQAHVGAIAARLQFPSDPTGPRLYAEDVTRQGVKYEHGYLIVPEGPGLGVEIDPERLKRLASPLQTDEASLPALQDRTVPMPAASSGSRT